MPKKVRRRIFYCLILVFLVLGTSVVLYAQGWRVGFRPITLAKVGAIYIRTFPADAQIKLDSKLKKRNVGLFDKGTLLNDILPGEYELEASAPGFQAITLPIAVDSSVVTSLKNLVLVPNSPKTTTSTPVQDVFLAGNTLLVRTANGARTLSGLPVPGEVLAGSEDGAVIISYSASSRNYFATETARATSTNMGRLPGQPAGKAAIRFQPVPADDTLFLLNGPAGLHLLRAPGGETLQISTTSAIAAAAGPGRIVWANFDAKTNVSLLYAYDILSRNRNANFEFVPGKITSIILQSPENIIALTSEGSLYSLNESSRVRLAQNVRSAVLSGDGSKLAVLDGKGIKTFLARDGQIGSDVGLSDAGRLQKLIWYRDNEHLFAQYPDKVMFLNMNDVSLRNFAVVTQASRAEYEPGGNILYFLEGSTLRELAFPSP